jgi:hypothetical protein
MKGPGMRLDLDVRRVWRCPACGHERRTSGDRTMVPCTACPERPLMSLVERKRTPRPLRPLPDVLIAFDPAAGDLPPLDSAAAPPETAIVLPEQEAAGQEASRETTPPAELTEGQPKRKQRRRRSRRKSAGKETPDVSLAPEIQDEVTPSAPSELSSGEVSRPVPPDAERPDRF